LGIRLEQHWLRPVGILPKSDTIGAHDAATCAEYAEDLLQPLAGSPLSFVTTSHWHVGVRLTYDARVIKAFEPKFMKVGILTAALQELTPRDVRDADPDRAIEDWVEFARMLGADYIQLSAALHPSETDVPPEAMLDPVANTLDLRQPFDKARARRVEAALRASRIGLSDVGYFDNLLHHDPAIRRKKHDFMLRAFDAASLLGVDAVCGFVGRNQQHTMDENLVDFEAHFVPLLKQAKERGLTFRVEQCPMPGWTTGDNFHNNIAYTPGTWMALHRICEKHGVGDQFRIHYDPSHAILMGQDTRSIFQYLKDTGYNFLIGGFHVKGQVIDTRGVSAWGYGGQTVERGDYVGGTLSPKPQDQLNAWKKQTVLAEHELPGTAKHDPLAYLQNRTVDWLDHQLAARELLALDVANTHLVVEHEYPKARLQDRARVAPILQGSIAFVRHIDEAAASMFALQHEVLAAQGIPTQGIGREPYRS
jgi:sugar phosphate isomerase/epimerase